jgi:hypothetical protein
MPVVTIGSQRCTGPQGSILTVRYSYSGFQPGAPLILQFIDGHGGAILNTENLGSTGTGSGSGSVRWSSPESNHVYRIRIIDTNTGSEGAANFISSCPSRIRT